MRSEESRVVTEAAGANGLARFARSASSKIFSGRKETVAKLLTNVSKGFLQLLPSRSIIVVAADPCLQCSVEKSRAGAFKGLRAVNILDFESAWSSVPLSRHF